MRYSLLLASALVVGALARPQPRRRTPIIVTETEVVTTTIVVYVTEYYVEPSPTPTYTTTTALLQSTSAATSATPSPFLTSSWSAISTTEVASTPATTRATERPAPSSALKVTTSSTKVPEPSAEPQPEPQPEPEPEPRPQPSSTSIEQPLSRAAPELRPSTAASLDNHVSGPDQAYLSAGPEYQAAMLYHHNAARANHGAKPLTWDAECEANARIAAKKCLFEHYIPKGADQGQNLFTVSGDAFNATAGVTTSWYQGELAPMTPWFGKPDVPDEVFHSVGHLTQLVWKSTTKVGCVSLDCGDTMIVGGSTSSMNKYTVCNYAPAGNMGGEYAMNVAAPISSTDLGGWAN
ncbi:hypothetical protein J1614_000113 [Plenodomus biglobosus]|nr:hypothetical protein J1614_000113 [Plenodomus biglobosus]